MNFDDLDYSVVDQVATILLNRPDKKNAMANQTIQNIVSALKHADADETVRVIVITGAGDAFCAGGDFQDMFQSGAGRTDEQWAQYIDEGPNEFVRAARSVSKPIVAAINGVAVGGGVTMALGCDIRIASEEARFALPFSKIGITPEFGSSYLLPRIVGVGNAMHMLMTADFVDAKQALQIGLVSSVLPHAEFNEGVKKLTDTLRQNSATSLRDTKKLIYASMSTDLDQMLELEAQTIGVAFNSEDHKKAVEYFLNRK